MTSHRSSPRPHLPHLAWIVSALLLLSLLGWSGVPATSAPPALTLHSPAPGELHLTWPAVTPAPPAYHVRYAPADTPTLIEQATSPTPSLTLYELEPGVVYTVQVRAGTGPWSVPVLQRIDDYRADPETVGTIGVGAEETGYIESAGDTDWFFVDLAAGEGYPIEVTGAPAPPLAVYDATGAVVQQGLAWHHASALTFTPATAGLYHVAVGGPEAAPGRYTLTVDEPPTTGSRRSRTLAGATPTAAPAPQRATALPAKPRGLSATASHDQVVLTWDDPQDASITGYVILRRVRENDTGGAFSVLVADTGSAATTYTDATVSANTTYTYRIKALNAYGVSERSRWFHIDIPAAPEPEGQAAEPPTKPTGLSATATHNTVVLTWDDPDDDSITGYVILRRVRVNDTGGEFSELVADTGTAATTYTDDSVQANTTYTYRIKATNEHGVSERSRWFHIDTPAAPEAVEGDDPDGEDDDGAPGGPGKRANVSEPDGEDLPTTTSTTGEVDVGGSVTGNIANSTDLDWFAVELEAGKRYQIDMEGSPTGRGTLPRPGLDLFNAMGTYLNVTNIDGGVGRNARVIYTADATGTYFVQAQEARANEGTYTLSVILLGANGASEADTDFPADNTTTGRVDVGASATGNIESATDSDWFRVDLEAGKTYQFDLEGAHNGRGTLPDPYLFVYDGFGTGQAQNNDVDNSLGNLNSRGVFAPTATGTYYLEASEANSANTGTYTLSVRDITPPPDDSADPPADSGNVSEPDGEDLPEGITTTGRVEVGGSVTGEIAPALDVDWFAVELKKGKRYQFDVEGADTGRGNLADPHLWGLQDAGGQAISGARSNDGGVGKNGRVINTPDAEGTYYIAVAGAASTTGTYTLSVIVLGANGASEADTDFPRDTTTTGRVEVGASATGNIDPGEDLDGFRVNLEAGKRYRFDLEGADTGRGSQADPILALYGDSFNVSHYIDEDDDGGEGLNSRLTYTATATGIYHLEVAGLDPGTYTLSVREILLAVAVPPGGLGPSEIPGAVRNVSVSYSPVSGIGGQIVWWDAPDETQTGAQWITEFHIYGSVSGGCDGYLLDEYVVDHPGFTTPPTDSNGNPTGFKYFKQVDVGPVRFGVAAVNALGEGPCAEGPDDPPDPINYDDAACTLNTGDIWCGVMTVGNITHQGSTIAHGFLDDPERGGGSLVDNTGDRELFTGFKVYTVTGIFVGSTGALDGSLFVNLDNDLSDDELAALALHIDVDGTTLQLDIVTNGVTITSDTWPFSETDTFSSIKGQYAWTGENLDDWSTATTVTVRLRGADNS